MAIRRNHQRRVTHSAGQVVARRRAFTLLEILLALGLTVVLLAAVYMSLDLYWKYANAGREEMERSQLARMLLRKIETDLRSIVYREAEQSDSDEDLDVADEEQVGMLADGTDVAEAFTNGSAGLTGDSQSLVLHISKPSRAANYGIAQDSEELPELFSDLKSVSYFLAESGGDGLQGVVGSRAASGNSNSASSGGTQGLARLEGDRLAIEMADAAADLDSLAESTNILAKEVDLLQFRYFDGVDWLEEWDTSVFGALPLAVEITIGFRPPEHARAATAPNELYVLVVALPLASANTEF